MFVYVALIFGLWSLSHCARGGPKQQIQYALSSLLLLVDLVFFFRCCYFKWICFFVELHIHSGTLVYRIDVLVENVIANLWSSRHRNNKNQAFGSPCNISVISSRFVVYINARPAECAVCRQFMRCHMCAMCAPLCPLTWNPEHL